MRIYTFFALALATLGGVLLALTSAALLRDRPLNLWNLAASLATLGMAYEAHAHGGAMRWTALAYLAVLLVALAGDYRRRRRRA